MFWFVILVQHAWFSLHYLSNVGQHLNLKSGSCSWNGGKQTWAPKNIFLETSLRSKKDTSWCFPLLKTFSYTVGSDRMKDGSDAHFLHQKRRGKRKWNTFCSAFTTNWKRDWNLVWPVAAFSNVCISLDTPSDPSLLPLNTSTPTQPPCWGRHHACLGWVMRLPCDCPLLMRQDNIPWDDELTDEVTTLCEYIQWGLCMKCSQITTPHPTPSILQLHRLLLHF